MWTFNLKTSVYFLFSVILSIFTENSLAADSPQSDIEKIKIQTQLRQLYTDKKKPFPTILTEGYREQKHAEIQKPSSPQNSNQMGGVSDGGGNAVGQTFFDFFENEGSLEITLDELLALEPMTLKMLIYLNEEVPAVGNMTSGGFGDILKSSLKGKKLYLESKPITSEACLNRSLVASDQQTVVACQTDEELRFNVRWLQDANSINRSGLFTHELILGWARSNFKNMPKQSLEQKVRELNRRLYEETTEKNPAGMIMTIFEKRAYSSKNYKTILTIPTKIRKSTVAFCENSVSDVNSEFAEIMKDEFLRMEISEQVRSMLKHSESMQSGGQSESDIQFQNGFCEDYRIDKLPIHTPKMDILPERCVHSVSEAAQDVSKYFNDKNSGLSPAERKWLLSGSINLAKVSANLCSTFRGIELEKRLFMTQEKGHRMMDETYAEAINYFRYLLQQQGIKVSFMREYE